ncbi:OsmC family protein [Fluoribacter dumoffii]|uniref:OsmC-like protein n=1 Tax=Fluoribacter dumoffii TaxID=463 RepID=A0A377G7I4_9GAMM|nr:OsmC family protein [Fluoribacter dumoffii]KTC89331.1 OsmC-like protein [Fluoribacter dumoffii NY 23]MCW8386910.1 OsmC family protein [Fluoribacter dumoffii]MCW8417586.1 OsmC family protein [Fluoribacter dumoffii]MCW8454573.1 OsmC family protein [Fluoribacter dumoffii]MCW8461351.1 OsmC family protein [Fluoribacter dumoffii]
MESTNNKLLETTVQESKKGKFTQEIIIGEHHLIADEPTSFGGNDLGPSPYDFLLAALGSCTSMTIRMYAENKKFPLEQVIVKLTHEKTHVEDCVGCEKASAKIDRITRRIELRGKLTEEQRSRLLEIANMCPVHRTLTSKILINTELIG